MDPVHQTRRRRSASSSRRKPQDPNQLPLSFDSPVDQVAVDGLAAKRIELLKRVQAAATGVPFAVVAEGFSVIAPPNDGLCFAERIEEREGCKTTCRVLFAQGRVALDQARHFIPVPVPRGGVQWKKVFGWIKNSWWVAERVLIPFFGMALGLSGG